MVYSVDQRFTVLVRKTFYLNLTCIFPCIVRSFYLPVHPAFCRNSFSPFRRPSRNLPQQVSPDRLRLKSFYWSDWIVQYSLLPSSVRVAGCLQICCCPRAWVPGCALGTMVAGRRWRVSDERVCHTRLWIVMSVMSEMRRVVLYSSSVSIKKIRTVFILILKIRNVVGSIDSRHRGDQHCVDPGGQVNDRRREDQQSTFTFAWKGDHLCWSWGGGSTINAERINSQLSLSREKAITSVDPWGSGGIYATEIFRA